MFKPCLRAAYRATHQHVTRPLHLTARLFTMPGWRTKRPVRLVLDYDGTLTVDDTMSILGTIPKRPKVSWKQIVEAYVKDYDAWSKRGFPWQNYDRAEYSSWLASRKSIEHQSALRVRQFGFFQGVTQRDVQVAVDRAFETGALKLRPGWTDLVEACSCGSNTAEIVSVNWSETAIRHALQISVKHLQVNPNIAEIPIFANELDSLDGQIGLPRIQTSGDKLQCMNATRAGSLFTVYIGDSSTDFDCLCEADIGIWLYDVPKDEYEEASKKVFAPLNYVPPPLSTLEDLEGSGKAMFYWAPDFRTVLESLCIHNDK